MQLTLNWAALKMHSMIQIHVFWLFWFIKMHLLPRVKCSPGHLPLLQGQMLCLCLVASGNRARNTRLHARWEVSLGSCESAPASTIISSKTEDKYAWVRLGSGIFSEIIGLIDTRPGAFLMKAARWPDRTCPSGLQVDPPSNTLQGFRHH